MIFLIVDQGIGDATEGSLDCFFVSDQSLSLLRPGGSKIAAEPAGLENGLGKLSPEGPGSGIGV